MPAMLRPEHALGILDIADNAIVCVDAGQRIVFFNQGAERIFGWRAAEIVGRDLALLMPARYRADHGQRTADFLAGPDTARKMGERGTICGVRRDGSEFPAEATISRSHGPDGPILTAILQDISARRAWERELVAAREQAEAAVQAKSMFLANMSHEIRTPLNAVIGMTSLLLDSALDEEQRDYAATIRNSGEALLAIINDLLDFSKIDAGRLDLERHPFEVRTCAEDALDLLASSAGAKRIELVCAIDPAVPATVLGDGARLRQVLVNLLSNAIKFTHHGEVVLEVQAAPLEGDMHALRFTVRDTGIGIPDERLRDIFEPFTQVDASTTRKYGGTGLGLAISRRLAQVMGGTLEVESEVGSGSAFTLALGLEAVGAGSTGNLLQARAAHLKGKRILLVDDNGTNRRILVRQALLWGMEPSAAASGIEALDLVRHGNGFDVAVLDMHMPDMNGAQLAQRIARHSTAPPLVLLTSVGERFRPGAASDPLFSSTLNKPVKPAALLEALLDALGEGAQAVAAAAVVAAEAATAAAPEAPLPALDILVAEDNTINQKVIKQLLRHLGHRADVAANGLEVLAALERQDYGVILMDMQMPEMDGLEATRRLRLRFRGAAAPYIVAMTANALPGDRERCLEAGADAYLSKPVVLEQLRQALAVARHGVAERRRLPAIVNPARMQELRATEGGDESLLRDVIAAFLDEVPGLLEQVSVAVRDGDGRRLASTAHYLLSSIDFIGAERMRLPCANLELLGKADNAAAARDQLALLVREYALVEEKLRAKAGAS